MSKAKRCTEEEAISKKVNNWFWSMAIKPIVIKYPDNSSFSIPHKEKDIV